MLVPSSAAGGIIGKQGQTLKLIRKQTCVAVTVARNASSSGERFVTASGPLADVATAAAMVLGIVDQSSSAAALAMHRTVPDALLDLEAPDICGQYHNLLCLLQHGGYPPGKNKSPRGARRLP